jgi:hypothetical protein
LRSEATDGCHHCFLWNLAFPGGLKDGFFEQLFFAFGAGLAELREGFVELALDSDLVAEEELRFGNLGRVQEKIGEGAVRVGFGVVLKVGVDTVVEVRGFHALKAFQSPSGRDGSVGERALNCGLGV